MYIYVYICPVGLPKGLEFNQACCSITNNTKKWEYCTCSPGCTCGIFVAEMKFDGKKVDIWHHLHYSIEGKYFVCLLRLKLIRIMLPSEDWLDCCREAFCSSKQKYTK